MGAARKNILVTGRPGVGKTTLVRRVAEALSGEGIRCGGFYTEEVREEGERVGFRIVTLDGEEGVLAWKGLRSSHRVGKYGVNVRDIEGVAVGALRRALKGADVVVIDEIAKMELFCPSFAPAVRECLDSPLPVLATMQMRSLPFIEEVKGRGDVRLFTITPGNREGLVLEVLEAIRAALTEGRAGV